MLYNHFTEELLGLQGVKVTNIEKEDNNIIIYLEMERKSHSCPCCGTDTEKEFDLKFPSSDISSINLGNDGYISFWVRSNLPITTKCKTDKDTVNWENTFADSVPHLKTFGGDNVWKEYRIYKSELNNTDTMWGLHFWVYTENLTADSSVSVEFSGFAVYTKLDPENNIYQAVPEKTLTKIILSGNANGNKRYQINPWRDNATKANGVMTAAMGDVTSPPDGSQDFGKYYSFTVGENFYTVDYSSANRMYMLLGSGWAANLDFSVLKEGDSFLRLWVKTPHSATFILINI